MTKNRILTWHVSKDKIKDHLVERDTDLYEHHAYNYKLKLVNTCLSFHYHP